MTFKSLFGDLQVFALFLLAGYLLREFIPILRKLFLPASLIGGAVALIGGQQLLGLWTVPESFSQYNSQLVVLVVAALIWGMKFDRKRATGYIDFMCVLNAQRFAQMTVGLLVGMGLSLVWPALPKGWGVLASCAYYGGHGNAATWGGVFEQITGSADYTGIGLIMATIGMVTAMTVGVAFVNIGIRKGYPKYLEGQGGKLVEKGLLEPEKRKPIGMSKVPSGSVNALIFQFAQLMGIIWLGSKVMKLLGAYVWSGFSSCPASVYGIVGGIIVWPLMCKLKLQDYCDKKTCSQISGFAMDLLVLTAIATMDLEIFSQFLAPILIHALAIIILTYLLTHVLCRYVCETEWFEKASFFFGHSTGNTTCGLALLRMIDPETKSSPAEAYGVAGAIWAVPFSIIPAVIPMMTIETPLLAVAITGAIALAFIAVPFVLFRKSATAANFPPKNQ